MSEQPRRQALRRYERDDIRRLTYGQMVAGDPCPACCRPLLDAEGGFQGKGTMNFTPDELEQYEAERETWPASHGHGRCDGGPWMMSGSLTTHCTDCCPPPPLSPSQIEKIGRIVRYSAGRRGSRV